MKTWDEALRDGDGDMGGSEPPPPPAPTEPTEESPVARAARLPLNDFGNGQRVIVHFGEGLMFVARVGWFVWDGRVWAQDFDGMRVRRKAHEIPALIARESFEMTLSHDEQQIVENAENAFGTLEALRAKGTKRTAAETTEMRRLSALQDRADQLVEAMRKKQASRLRHAKAAGNSGPITNMLHEAEPYVERKITDLNVDPLAICCESGVLELVRELDAHEAEWNPDAVPRYLAKLREHKREDRITKMMPVEYDPAAECPVFDRFLEEIQPDPEIRAFVLRWYGYSLTGLTSEQKLVFQYGVGRNGKSTLIDLIARMMGEYATSVPIETLTGSEQRKGADATPDLVRIPGARLVRASEPEEGLRFKEAMVKLLTGGEPIMIRKMREEFVEVEPIFKLTISGNHKPNVRGTDDGIWRRILLVPFTVQIDRERIDPMLSRKLWAERSGILNRLIQGALDFLNGGLCEPDAVRQATEDFRDDSDPIRTFLCDACEVTGDAEDFVLARDLADAFRCYQREQGQAEWGQRTVSLRFVEKADAFVHPVSKASFTRRKTATANGFAGVRLSQAMSESLDRMRAAAKFGGRKRGEQDD